jgi:phosphate transport system protein
MFKEIAAIWKDGSIMHQVLQKVTAMARDAEYVYSHAWEVCTGQAVADRTLPGLKAHDKDVNRGERAVRRMIVEHLTINPGKDVSGCLAVMIMAKDLERIGDHSRNIFRVGMRINGSICDYALHSRLDTIQKGIGSMLSRLERAIPESDEQLARNILLTYQETKQQTKDLEAALFETPMDTVEAVNTTLLTRFFTRLNAHVGNATSAIIFPLEDIDFVSRGLKREQRPGQREDSDL